ncbi:hypothetical protein DPMN_152020 [Dreissena polymorpha]|uniref:Uncharacterized protein n=1 Tax=Dreissena polymorpha TaxID=45954 RepID=A0A9D4FI73_DREPO|nr:hypothetical protein DPMN_152020 [Dreissena polymorpha]
MKIDTPSGGHVFQQTGTSFGTQTIYHKTKYLTINMTSIVKTVPPPGGHVFRRSGTIFKLTLDIIQTNGMTKFHDDWTKHLFLFDIAPFFELDQDLIRKNLWTKFHENPTKI